MERSSLLKWLFFGIAIFLFMQFGMPSLFGTGASSDKQPLDHNDQSAPPERLEDKRCNIEGARFTAQLSTRGASLRSIKFAEEKYQSYKEKASFLSTFTGELKTRPIDLVTTDHPARMPLRTDLRVPGAEVQQVPFNELDWRLESSDAKSCVFKYESPETTLTKTVAATGNAFELEVTLKVENRAAEARPHRLSLEQTSWVAKKDTEGSLGSLSEHLAEVVVGTVDGKTHRQGPGDFEAGDFKDPEFTPEKWRRAGEARWVATSSSYFTKALVPLDAPAKPFGETLIEEYTADHSHGYRSRLAYPEQKLEPGASVTYRVLSFTGPKERDVLAHVAGGAPGVSDVIDLGWFGAIGKILVQYVGQLYKLTGSWGWAICLLTITVKLLLFPLSIAQIKSSFAMRQLKPETDAINAKYKDDAAQRGLAMQELWRKNKVANPLTGCLPLLLQMPVWFALYQALQTAVELYHTPFGPKAFIPDLSAPGQYFIIPLVLGASSFFQQKIMPPQGDPAQQKMMLYMMPAIFTVMMLFLPAGLGVYMLTNTWLGITQQVLVERYYQSKSKGGIEVREKKDAGGKDSRDSGDDGLRREATAAPALGKGKARARG